MSRPITSTPVRTSSGATTAFAVRTQSPVAFFQNQNDASSLSASSLRRKRPIAKADASLSSQPDGDEEERSKRRNVVDLQKKSSTATGQLSFLDSVKLLGEREIKEQIQLCSKLYNENKINASNAWRIQIIDILNQLTKKDSADTLHLASKSLDISSRVYSVRVDDAHSHGITLASNIARMSAQPSAEAEGEADETGMPAKRSRKRSQKRQRRSLLLAGGEKATVAKDKTANLGKLEMLDSVIFSARARPERSATDNLFTNGLHMDHTSTRFEMLSEDKFWCDKEDEAMKHSKMVPNFMQGVDLAHSRLVTDHLRDFFLDEWNPDDEELNESIEEQNQLVLDDKGNPIPELDGSVNDIFADNLPDEVFSDHSDDVVLQVAAQQHPVAAIETFIDTKNPDQCEYTYNPVVMTQSGKAMEQIWAGPSHWKLKCIRGARARYHGSVQEGEEPNGDGRKRRHMRKKAEVGEVDLVSGSGSSSEDEEVERRLGGPRGRELVMQRRMKIIKVKKNSHTTKPKNLHVPILEDAVKRWERDLLFLQLSDCVEVTQKKDGEGKEADAQDKDNPAGGDKNEEVKEEVDSDGSIFGGGDNEPDETHNDNNNADDSISTAFPTCSQATAYMGDNLIDMPEMVNKVSINFATTAKRMDMKKLKEAVWGILTKSNSSPGKRKPTYFSDLYKQLPAVLTKRMRDSLSVHLAFFSVLHLANDHNLQLEKQSKGRNFAIKFGSD